jgi:hypothetical protein
MGGVWHLRAVSYCHRYRPAARMPWAIDTSMRSHLGSARTLRAGRPP